MILIPHAVNWYRTREQNYKDDLALLSSKKINLDIPVLFIRATRDPALRPELSAHMGKYLPRLTVKEVEASHWALWENPQECNEAIGRWVEDVVFGQKGGRSKI